MRRKKSSTGTRSYFNPSVSSEEKERETLFERMRMLDRKLRETEWILDSCRNKLRLEKRRSKMVMFLSFALGFIFGVFSMIILSAIGG